MIRFALQLNSCLCLHGWLEWNDFWLGFQSITNHQKNLTMLLLFFSNYFQLTGNLECLLEILRGRRVSATGFSWKQQSWWEDEIYNCNYIPQSNWQPMRLIFHTLHARGFKLGMHEAQRRKIYAPFRSVLPSCSMLYTSTHGRPQVNSRH